MQNSNASKTLAEDNRKLIKAAYEQQLVDETLYTILVGSLSPSLSLSLSLSLFYVVKQTQPDIV